MTMNRRRAVTIVEQGAVQSAHDIFVTQPVSDDKTEFCNAAYLYCAILFKKSSV